MTDHQQADRVEAAEADDCPFGPDYGLTATIYVPGGGWVELYEADDATEGQVEDAAARIARGPNEQGVMLFGPGYRVRPLGPPGTWTAPRAVVPKPGLLRRLVTALKVPRGTLTADTQTETFRGTPAPGVSV